MQLKTKKRIAKEILLLLGSGLFTLTIFLFVYPYNWYCSSKSDGVQTIIATKTIQADSLLSQYNQKLKQQKWFYEQNLKEYDVSTYGYNTYDDLWKRLEVIYINDSIEIKYSKTWGRELVELLKKVGFQNAQMFKEFVGKNIFDQKDKADKLKSDYIQNEIVQLNSEKRIWDLKALSINEQRAFAVKAFIGLLIILYPLRFLFWLIVWSFKTLKQNGE